VANTYAGKPARGLSKLQKAILVHLSEERDWWIEMGLGREPVLLPWRIQGFYGGVHPLEPALGLSARKYTAKERAAVSRSLTRLYQRGLVELYARGPVKYGEKVKYVVLTAKGVEMLGLVQKLTT